eukprot:9495283-Pyramimonas_sp.AAC.1
MNKLARYCKETREVCICFRSDILHKDEDLRSVVLADFSLNNVDDYDLGPIGEKVKSQVGLVCLLSDDGFYKHQEGPAHFLDWGSSRIKRVCRAPMGAEAHGLSEGAEALEWIRALYSETDKPNQPLGDL